MPEAARQQGPALFPSGVVCDRFRIDGVLGVGGTGTVFRALDLERDEVVALKAIPHDATLRQRARREASVAGKLRHPNVVRLRSVHEDGQYVYIASDIVEGMDLAGALRQGQLGDTALLRVAAAVCEGLSHAHENGVVHRDVKPANVLLGRDGTVRVLDFGIASLDEPDATVDDRMLGTLSYMAPETCQGARPTPATDVWAVGVLVYEALTGANPYRARTPEELRERHKHPPRSLAELRPDLPRALAAAVARALESHPRRRPRAEALGRVLSAAADSIERPGARAAHGGGGGGSRRSLPSLPRVPKLSSLPALPAPAVAALARAAGHRRRSRRLGGRALALWFRGAVRAGPAHRAHRGRQCLLRDRHRSRAGRVPVLAGRPRPAARVPGAALALASPWLAAAFALAVCVPALGDVSAGLAWCAALGGGLWLVACLRAGRRALLPAARAGARCAVPVAALRAGRRQPAQRRRPRAGRCGRAVRDRALGRRAARRRARRARPTPRPSAAPARPGRGTADPAERRLGDRSGRAALRVGAARRGLFMSVWLAGLLVGQAALPALAGAAPEPPGRSVVAIWAVAILLVLGVRAPDGDAPAGKPVSAEE